MERGTGGPPEGQVGLSHLSVPWLLTAGFVTDCPSSTSPSYRELRFTGVPQLGIYCILMLMLGFDLVSVGQMMRRLRSVVILNHVTSLSPLPPRILMTATTILTVVKQHS